MSTKEIKQAFRYEKIPIKEEKKQGRQGASNNIQTIGRIWQYLAVEKWRLLLVIFMVLLSSTLGLLGPFLVGVAIDDFIVTKKTTGLLLLLGALILIYILHALSVFLQNFWII